LHHSIIILQYYRVIDNDNSSSCHSIGLHGASVIAGWQSGFKINEIAKLTATSK